MTIRHYEPRDLGEIIRLFNDYRVFYEQDSDIKLAERFIRERIEGDESLIFVADAGNNALVGFASCIRRSVRWLLHRSTFYMTCLCRLPSGAKASRSSYCRLRRTKRRSMARPALI